MSAWDVRLAANLTQIQDRIADACHQAHRDPSEVRLIAVTKYGDASLCQALANLGARDFGESRPQDLWTKASRVTVEPPIRWHVIGHLQRNKLARTIPWVHLLHAGDRWSLLTEISDHQIQRDLPPLPTLLEVNISGDPAKHGFSPEDIRTVIGRLEELPGVSVRGLMAMAGWGTSPSEARGQFAAVRELRDRLARETPSGVTLGELSLGMSGDFPEAILEGATYVRVGSALTEGIS